MLAKTSLAEVAKSAGIAIEPDIEREDRHENKDFPSWLVLLCEPSREFKSKQWLKKCGIFTYLPTFRRWHCRRAGRRYMRDCAVIPGLLFMPQIMTWIDNYAKALDWSRVRSMMHGADGSPIKLELPDIEVIMRMEAKLNKPDSPVDARGNEIRIGQPVRFIDPDNERLFGEAKVFEVASYNRIGVEASGLFGGRVKVYVPAAEIEVM